MIGFFIALEHSYKDDLCKDLEGYLDTSAAYILAMETVKDKHIETKGQHFHFVGHMTDVQYDSFRKTIIVKKYKRQGIAKDGIGRQYGKVRKIRDETKLMQYTVKDYNIIYKNIDLKTIQELYRKSYHAEDRRFPFEELMEHLKANSNLYYHIVGEYKHSQTRQVDFRSIETAIIQFYLNHSKCEKIVTKSQLKSITTRYLMYYSQFINIDDIYNYIHN